MTERVAPVAVDAMGGDHAPGAIVQGAINAARKGLALELALGFNSGRIASAPHRPKKTPPARMGGVGGFKRPKGPQ